MKGNGRSATASTTLKVTVPAAIARAKDGCGQNRRFAARPQAAHRIAKEDDHRADHSAGGKPTSSGFARPVSHNVVMATVCTSPPPVASDAHTSGCDKDILYEPDSEQVFVVGYVR